MSLDLAIFAFISRPANTPIRGYVTLYQFATPSPVVVRRPITDQRDDQYSVVYEINHLDISHDYGPRPDSGAYPRALRRANVLLSFLNRGFSPTISAAEYFREALDNFSGVMLGPYGDKEVAVHRSKVLAANATQKFDAETGMYIAADQYELIYSDWADRVK